MSTFDLRLEQAGAALLRDEKARSARFLQEMERSAKSAADIVARRAPQDLGNLRKDIYVIPAIQLESVSGGTHNGYSVMIDRPYAGIVDLGARPHTPPLAPLIGWAMRHANLSSPIGAGNSRDAESVAYAIAKRIQSAIAARGNRPTFFVRDAMPAIIADLHLKIAQALARG